MPFFSIITPTLQRESLKKCCESVRNQTFTDWEHIIVVDGEFAEPWIGELNYGHSAVVIPGKRFNDFGNTPRWMGWQWAHGGYLIYLDDDNTFADNDALSRIADSLLTFSFPPVAIFPILRHGRRFYSDEPRCCHVDTANLVVKHHIGRWPARPEYTMDGIFIEQLVKEHGHTGFPDVAPIICVPESRMGK